jgi:UDP-2,3-diacylglucosamine pyrophosphatase LpxH
MKILAIPDVHGTHYWEKAKDRLDDYDKVIFLGDYVDNWVNKWPDQMDNLLSIIEFKKQNADKVVLLWGNHDTSYYLGEHCSGHQPDHDIDITEVYRLNKDVLDAVYIESGYLFAHGGVSSKWMKCAGIKDVSEINQLFKEKPNYFRWVGPNGYGDNLNEGPLWIRPRALGQVAVKGYIQVVGHSEVNGVTYMKTINGKDQLVIIDSKDHDHLFELDI